MPRRRYVSALLTSYMRAMTRGTRYESRAIRAITMFVSSALDTGLLQHVAIDSHAAHLAPGKPVAQKLQALRVLVDGAHVVALAVQLAREPGAHAPQSNDNHVHDALPFDIFLLDADAVAVDPQVMAFLPSSSASTMGGRRTRNP